jgi:RhtB (resistance to homoserine/threonine) family protein
MCTHCTREVNILSHYWAFVVTSMLLILTPGIDTALVTRNMVSSDTKGGWFTACGIASGILVHTLAAGLGLSAILMASSNLFEVVKIIGAVYLIFLGIQSLRSRQIKQELQGNLPDSPTHQSPLRLYRQGILTNVLNPKVALFFLTFLPQFTDTNTDFFYQVLFLGLTYSGLTLGWFACYILLVNRIRQWLMRPKVQQYIEKITGLVLIGFGIRLAVETRHH